VIVVVVELISTIPLSTFRDTSTPNSEEGISS